MPRLQTSDASIYYEISGVGDPMVLVHGSWDDHHVWDQVVPDLARSFRVVTYDRRGHGQSNAPARQGSVHEDLADLEAVIQHVGSPAHVVGNSFGAAITVALAARDPGLFRSLCGHEPPLIGLLMADPETRPVFEEFMRGAGRVAELIAAGRSEDGARTFVNDVAIGPGVWEAIPEPGRQMMVQNAPTFLDELRDPDAFTIDLSGLAHFPGPALMTAGDQSPAFFGVVLSKLMPLFASAERRTIPGAGHVPHETLPIAYVEIVREFARSA